MFTYNNIDHLEYVADCTSIDFKQWNSWMDGAKRGSKKEINKLVKEHLPELYARLALNFYNPYNYLRTDKHLIVVHSGIEYFIKYKRRL